VPNRAGTIQQIDINDFKPPLPFPSLTPNSGRRPRWSPARFSGTLPELPGPPNEADLTVDGRLDAVDLADLHHRLVEGE
jgi:hypothetical protein